MGVASPSPALWVWLPPRPALWAWLPSPLLRLTLPPHHHPLLDERPPGCQLFAAATAPVVFLGRSGVPALTRPSGAPCGRGVGVRRLALSPARAPARPAVPAPRLTFLTRRRGAAEVQLRCGAGHSPARPFARPSREASCSAEPARVGVTSKGGRRAPRPAVGCPRGAFFVVVLLKSWQHRRAVRDARLSRSNVTFLL